MKRKSFASILLLTLLFTCCLFFFSCEKERYNPKQKIKEIYTEYPGYYPKHLTEVWTWDKNQLAKIDYYSGNSIDNTEHYFYEKKKLVKVEDEEKYFEINYDGSKFKRIECYRRNGNLLVTFDFTYTDNKISKIIYTDYYNDVYSKDGETGFFSKLISKEFAKEMLKLTKKNKPTKDGSSYVYTFTYKYDGDNIKEKKMEYIDEETGVFNIIFTYKGHDNNFNPFYKYVGMPYPNEFIATDFVSSKNNPLEIHRERSEDYERELTTRYTYTYKDKFPTEIQKEEIYEGGTIMSKYYYEYQ